MDFIVRKDASETVTYMTIQDGDTIVLNLELPRDKDNVQGWETCLFYLQSQAREELEILLSAVPQLVEISVSEDAYPTYRNVLQAVFKFLEQRLSHDVSTDERAFYTRLYKLRERFLFHFRAERQPQRYLGVFSVEGRERWRFLIPCDKFDEAPVQVCQVALAASYQKEPEEVRDFVENYRHFRAGVAEADPTTTEVFVGLSKALVNLIRQQTADLGMYVSVVPEICAFIVKSELEDVEEQRTYLEPILSSREDEKKLRRLNGIIQDIKQDIDHRKQGQAANPCRRDHQGEDDNERLMRVIGLISEHYLDLYDLDRSDGFWKKADSKDPMLRFLLILHRHPHFLLVAQLPLLGFFSLFAYQHRGTADPLPLTLDTPLNLQCIAILTWYAVLLMLISVILVQIFRRRWLYSQLLLPRLLGASIVGLAVLLLDDLPWKIGIRCSPINWLLITLFTYSGSFFYIFIEIYNTTKFVRGRSIRDALKSTRRIYMIALSETLFIVTVASSLVFPVVDLDLADKCFGIHVNLNNSLIPGLSNNWLSFGVFPALIVLWTGSALFIGSFVQLMWQDRQITAPV